MCGISAIFSKREFTYDCIQKMNTIIKHRGPDGEGIMGLNMEGEINISAGPDTSQVVLDADHIYCPTKTQSHIKYRCALGHRRLSIIDLSSAGHMPMCSPDQRFWITYNGEIYNFIEVKSELINMGYTFQTKTDTEVILSAYKEWGEECLHKFVGMWSFIILDVIDNIIFAARDRFGIKPLYYWIDAEGTLYFASEIKQFTVMNTWEANINHQRAYDFLQYAISDHTDETLFKGVFQVLPGCSFKSSIDTGFRHNSRIQIKKWYQLKREPLLHSFSEACKIFREKLTLSVKLHLRSDVPIGSSLSGGLDSSAIVCIEDKIFKEENIINKISTFSCCSVYAKYDEKKWCDIVIDNASVEPNFIYPSISDSLNSINDIVWHQDEPYPTQSIFFSYSLFKNVKEKGIKVLLNGQGSDEYLGGYGQFTQHMNFDLIKNFSFYTLFSNSKSFSLGIKDMLSALKYKLVQFLLPYKVLSPKNENIFNEQFLKFRNEHPFSQIPLRQNNIQAIINTQLFYNPLPRFLHWEDRNSMASSIESRIPFLDHRVVEYCYNLPVEYFDNSGTTKFLLRESLVNILPEEIRNRKDKMGYVTPEEVWVKKEDSLSYYKALNEAVENCNGVVDIKVLDQFNNMIDKDLPYDNVFTRIIIFSRWMKVFNVKLT